MQTDCKVFIYYLLANMRKKNYYNALPICFDFHIYINKIQFVYIKVKNLFIM